MIRQLTTAALVLASLGFQTAAWAQAPDWAKIRIGV